MGVVSGPPLPADWHNVRIRLRRYDGWLWHWHWTVTKGILPYDSGLAVTREAAVRKANKAAAKAIREQAWNAEEEVWEFETPESPAGDA